MKRTPLARQSAKKKASGEPSLRRAGRINPVGKKMQADRKAVDAVREEVMARQNGLCALCGNRPATDLHHRQMRRHGNHTAANLVGLDRVCHNLMDEQRGWAIEWGWVLYSWDVPSRVPYGVRRTGSDDQK